MTHKPIKTEFRWTGDGFGNASARLFKQVKRDGDMAIYKRTVERTGANDGYEVIKISRHNGYTLGGQHVEPAETYPGSSQFGKSAWICVDLKHAEVLYNQKVTEAKTLKALEASGNAPKRRGRPRKVKV
jgi:hypothetical protein